VERPLLHTIDFRKITAELFGTEGLEPTASMVSRFLCGISSPLAARLRLYGLASFGLLEGYRYREVADWVAGRMAEMVPVDGIDTGGFV
jgi:ATP-dependent DNA helicase RecQ